MNNIIIVEGIDRVGKTTLVNKLVKELGYSKFIPANANLSYRELNPRLANIIETEKCYATLATLATLENIDYKIVFDRFHISEYVYGQVERGYTNNECYHIDEVLAQLNALLIYIHPTNIQMSSREHGRPLNKHYELFNEFINKTKLPIIECDYTTIPLVIKSLKEEIL